MGSKRVPDEVLQEMVRLREEGWSTGDLGRKYGITKEAAAHRLKLAGKNTWVTKRCDLPECQKEFKTQNIRKRYCCRQHTKRGSERERQGLKAKKMQCKLPECSEGFWAVAGHKKFCCKDHGDLHTRRIEKGIYKRILGKSSLVCTAPGCGERIILDEHHIEMHKNKSNKDGPTIWLCPTHHMAVHRSAAIVTAAGKYISLLPAIRKGLKRKGF